MATRFTQLISIFLISFLTPTYWSLPLVDEVESTSSYAYVQYKLAQDHHYRASLVTFLHRQPSGSHLATLRYSRIVFHCSISPGSLYLRFSSVPPLRTAVYNRQDPSTIFAFRSVGAFSRIQIQHYRTGLWLCMNRHGRIVTKANITLNTLACTFRQNSDGIYMSLTSELNPFRKISFDLNYLLSKNPRLRSRHQHLLPRARGNQRCHRFMFDSHIDRSLLESKQDH